MDKHEERRNDRHRNKDRHVEKIHTRYGDKPTWGDEFRPDEPNSFRGNDRLPNVPHERNPGKYYESGRYYDPRTSDVRFLHPDFMDEPYPYYDPHYAERLQRARENHNPVFLEPYESLENPYLSRAQEEAYLAEQAARARRSYIEAVEERGAFAPDVDDRHLGSQRPFHPKFSHRGKGPKDYIRRDVRIHEDVSDALTESHFVDASHIHVHVQDGVVVLSGTVDSRTAKRDAELAIENIAGIRNMENRLHVKHPDDMADVPEKKATKTKSKAETNTSKSRNGKVTS